MKVFDRDERCPKCGGFIFIREYDAVKDVLTVFCLCGFISNSERLPLDRTISDVTPDTIPDDPDDLR